jgi:hypothetical protein
MSNDTFHGWAATGKGLPLQWTELALKEFDEDTIEMDISHCGICGSDIHTMDSGWYFLFFTIMVHLKMILTKTKKFYLGDLLTTLASLATKL